MQLYSRILIISALDEAVEDLIKAIPSQVPKTLESPPVNPKDPKFPKGYYQRIINQNDVMFDIFGSAGDHIKYDFVLEVTLEGLPGVMLLVDQRRPESFDASKDILALLHSYNLEAPIVVVDTAPASDTVFMRRRLGMLETEPLLTCDLNDLNSIKNVILTLIRLIPEYAANQALLTALNQL